MDLNWDAKNVKLNKCKGTLQKNTHADKKLDTPKQETVSQYKIR